MKRETVIVLDFGGQYNQLIARRVRECNVYCEIYSYKTDLEKIKAMEPKGIIFTGGPNSVYLEDSPSYAKEIYDLGIPVLGICYGSQLMMHQLGGKVCKAPVREYGKIEVTVDQSSALFENVSEKTICWMSHNDYIEQAAPGFKIIAHTPDCPVAAVENVEKKLYATQFHPEVLHTKEGKQMLANFVFNVCGCAGSWKMDSFVEESIKAIREKVGDGKVLCALSGGVDSGYLAAASGADQAFTVGFDEGNRYNEVEKAAQVAKAAGLRHHVKIISKEEFWNSLPDVMYHMDEPSGDASAVALYFLAQEAAKHVKVVLSGEGADELFGGYNIYREPEALKMVGWIPFGIRRAVGRLAAKLPDVKGRDFLIRAGKKVEERFIGNAYIYGEKEKNQILKGGVTGQTTQEFLKPFYKEIENDRFLEKTDRTKHTHKVCRIEKKSGRDGLGKSHLQDMEKMQSVDLNYWLPGDILQKADKMSMAHSLEVRVPFLDKDVWTLAAGLPKEAKIADGTTKDIFRKAVSKYIPQDTDGRKKLGFPIPIRVWLRQDDWYQMVKELFTSKEAEEFFHTEKLLQLLREHKEGKKDNSRKIWTVLAFLIWHHTFFYKESSERQLQSN